MIVTLILLQAVAAAAPAPAPAAPEKLICRRDTATGSIMPGRICKTRAQWVKLDSDRLRAMQERSNNNTIDQHGGCSVGNARGC